MCHKLNLKKNHESWASSPRSPSEATTEEFIGHHDHQQQLAEARDEHVPLAAGVAAPLEIFSPAVGAIFMIVSTVVVSINAVLLRRVNLG